MPFPITKVEEVSPFLFVSFPFLMPFPLISFYSYDFIAFAAVGSGCLVGSAVSVAAVCAALAYPRPRGRLPRLFLRCRKAMGSAWEPGLLHEEDPCVRGV